MALFALYQVRADGTTHVLLTDIRPHGGSVRHRCTLPSQPRLIEEITEELRLMGLPPEIERKTIVGESAVQFFFVHRSPENSDTDSADAIREICLNRGIEALIFTAEGAQILPPVVKADLKSTIVGRPIHETKMLPQRACRHSR